MDDITNFLKEMEEQLEGPDVENIKFLLKDTLSSKFLNFIVSKILKIVNNFALVDPFL